MICTIYEDSDTAASIVRIIWFTRFSSGNFDLEDRERSDRPVVVEALIKIYTSSHDTWHHRDIPHISYERYKEFEKT